MSGPEYDDRRKTRLNGRRPGNDPRTRSHGENPAKRHKSLSEIQLAGDSYKGRPSFTQETKRKVFETTKKKVVDGVTLYQCAATKKFFPRDQMQIDHKVNWEDYGTSGAGYLSESGQVDQASMSRAYNNLENLHVIHASVNASKGKRARPSQSILQRLS